ncbi:MAG TPA: HAD family phosphatase [Clostridiales bacterium]|nr:HAD family phosphatase [Clostridiales bacterium]
MIRNIIFDMGNVLIPFRPDVYLEKFVENEEDRILLKRVVFQSLEWVKMDTGDLEVQEAEEIMLSRIPRRLHSAAKKLIYDWAYVLPPFEEMEQLIIELKNRGLRTFLLSNVGNYFYDIRSKIPALQLMDGEVISFDYGIIKPFPGIYRVLLSKYELKPEECFFIDDLPVNIYGASLAGIDGTVYHGDVESLRKILKSRGIL